MPGTRTVHYKNHSASMICLKRLRKPYGPASGDVVSVGSSLKNDPENPTWKVHVPVELVSKVCDHMLELAQKEEEPPPERVMSKSPFYHDFLL